MRYTIFFDSGVDHTVFTNNFTDAVACYNALIKTFGRVCIYDTQNKLVLRSYDVLS